MCTKVEREFGCKLPPPSVEPDLDLGAKPEGKINVVDAC